MSDAPDAAESTGPRRITEVAVARRDRRADRRDRGAEPEPDPNAVTITINGEPVAARKGEMVIAAAERAGEYIPHFCYHPRMTPVGMCRQCMVEVDSGRGPAAGRVVHGTGRRQEGRHTESTDGASGPRRACSSCCSPTTRSTARSATRAASARCRTRRSATVRARAGTSRRSATTRSRSRSATSCFLDRERCILCDRCTRFADEVAGDTLIHFTSRGNDTQVMTFPDEPFASYFSRQHRADLPGRCAHRQALPLQGPPVGPRAGREHLHHVLGRLPHRRAVEPRRARALPGRRQRPGQLGLAVRPGPLQLRVRSTPTSAWPTPLVRGEGGLVETSWNAALDAAAQLVRTRSTPVGPRASPCSAAPAGTNEDAYAWAQLADALGVAAPRRPARRRAAGRAARSAPGDHRRRRRGRRRSCCSARTSRRSCPSCYLRLRDAAEQRSARRIIEFTPGRDRAHAGTRGAASASSRAPRRPRRPRSPTPRSPSSSRAGPVVIVAGRANLAESAEQRRVRGAADAVARRLPGRQGAAGAAPRQRGRRAPARPRAAPTAATTGSAILARGRRRQDRPPRAARCRSDQRLSRCRPGPPRPRRRPPGDRRRHVPHRVVATRRRRARRRGVRREGRHDHQPRGSRHARSPSRSPPHGTSRPDWMIAAELGLTPR